jgi:hypothetical protein
VGVKGLAVDVLADGKKAEVDLRSGSFLPARLHHLMWSDDLSKACSGWEGWDVFDVVDLGRGGKDLFEG